VPWRMVVDVVGNEWCRERRLAGPRLCCGHFMTTRDVPNETGGSLRLSVLKLNLDEIGDPIF
jgi:hypothetical protein